MSANRAAPGSSLFERLRERGVLRVATSYAVIAWLVLQIADVVLEPWDVSPWVMQALMIVAVLGFPVAVALAWFLEVGDGGTHRDLAPAGSPRPAASGLRRYADVAVISVLTAVVGFFLMRDAGWLGDFRRPAALEDASLAVLPFANAGGRPEDAYLSEGLGDELRDQFSRLKSLQVTARSSSTAFRDESLDAVEIATRLGVAALVEGSLRRVGEHIRVSVQLVDGRDGRTLWSETYDRPRAELSQVQDEIAQSVVSAVLPKFGASGGLAGAGGDDARARDLYLLARHEERISEDLDEGPEAMPHAQRARELYEAALAVDPDFAQAHARLARVLLRQSAPFDSPERVRAADRVVVPAIEQALRLDPENSDAYLVKGLLLRWTNRPGGGEAYARALAFNPSSLDAANALSSYEFSMGRVDRVLELGERARRLDPMSLQAHETVAFAAAAMGRAEVVAAARTRMLKQFPDDPLAEIVACHTFYWSGAHDEAVACALRVSTARADDEAIAAKAHKLLGDAWDAMGDRERALAAYEQAAARGHEYGILAAARMRKDPDELRRLASSALARPLNPWDWYVAYTLGASGLPDEALAVYEAAGVADIGRTESNVKAYAMDGYAQLIALLRAAGRTQDADRMLPMLEEFSTTVLGHGGRFYDWRTLRAAGLVFAGRDDEALQELAAAVEAPGSPFPAAYVEASPVFAGLVHHPRFEAVMSRLRARQAEIRERLPETLSRHGLEPTGTPAPAARRAR